MNSRLNPQTLTRIVALLVVAIPAALYIVNALQFNTWIVDDAAITFAYARNFALGHGLVSQPEMPPVEGYSNFAWLLLLAPFFALGIFDPVLTPKLISILMVITSFALLYHTLKPLPKHKWIVFVALMLTALNTSFVAWTISGLENPLYLLLVVLLFRGSVRAAFENHTSPRSGALLGILAVLTALTRPDGLAFVLAFPAVLVFARRVGWRRKLIMLTAYGAAFALGYGLFLAFRLAYFGFPMPNTYYMKGGPDFDDVISLITLKPIMVGKSQMLLGSALGSLPVPLLTLTLGSFYLLFTRRWKGYLWAVFLFMLCAFGIYLLLPPDWMGEYRFATAFIPLLYLFAAILIATLIQRLPPRYTNITLAVLTVIAIAAAYNHFIPRTQRFSRGPTVPFSYIKNAFADRFNHYAEVLDVESGSVLLPDVGGMLYASNLIVHDLAGLTDATVARTLGTTRNHSRFYDYIFDEVQPTFIHTHGFWTVLANLDGDPRFAEQYAPICSYIDTYNQETYGVTLQSGVFVQRGIAEAMPEQVAALAQDLNEFCIP